VNGRIEPILGANVLLVKTVTVGRVSPRTQCVHQHVRGLFWKTHVAVVIPRDEPMVTHHPNQRTRIKMVLRRRCRSQFGRNGIHQHVQIVQSTGTPGRHGMNGHARLHHKWYFVGLGQLHVVHKTIRVVSLHPRQFFARFGGAATNQTFGPLKRRRG
jgi:hypothetical protein